PNNRITNGVARNTPRSIIAWPPSVQSVPRTTRVVIPAVAVCETATFGWMPRSVATGVSPIFLAGYAALNRLRNSSHVGLIQVGTHRQAQDLSMNRFRDWICSEMAGVFVSQL